MRLLSRDEVGRYLTHRCTIAGLDTLPVDTPALDAIYEIGRGNLRATDQRSGEVLRVGPGEAIVVTASGTARGPRVEVLAPSGTGGRVPVEQLVSGEEIGARWRGGLAAVSNGTAAVLRLGDEPRALTSPKRLSVSTSNNRSVNIALTRKPVVLIVTGEVLASRAWYEVDSLSRIDEGMCFQRYYSQKTPIVNVWKDGSHPRVEILHAAGKLGRVFFELSTACFVLVGEGTESNRFAEVLIVDQHGERFSSSFVPVCASSFDIRGGRVASSCRMPKLTSPESGIDVLPPTLKHTVLISTAAAPSHLSQTINGPIALPRLSLDRIVPIPREPLKNPFSGDDSFLGNPAATGETQVGEEIGLGIACGIGKFVQVSQGVLIDRSHILTAAHVFAGGADAQGNWNRVNLGAELVEFTHQGRSYRYRCELFPHPIFTRDLSAEHDIGIYQLEKEMDKSIDDIPIQQYPRLPVEGDIALNISSGPIPSGSQSTCQSPSPSDPLRDRITKLSYVSPGGIAYSVLTGPKKACPGNSGSPFLAWISTNINMLGGAKGQSGAYVIPAKREVLGVLSTAGAFRPVFSHYSWIQKVIQSKDERRNIIDIAFVADGEPNEVVAFYQVGSQGGMNQYAISRGVPDDLTDFQKKQPFIFPPGKEGMKIVGITAAKMLDQERFIRICAKIN